MCRKLIYLISFVVLLSAASSVQAICTVSTAYGDGADAYIANDGQPGDYGPNSNHGGEGLLKCRYIADSRCKITYLRFDISEVAGDMTGATLTMVSLRKGSDETLNVYGLVDGTNDNWNESTITYNTAPGFDPCALGYYLRDADLPTPTLGTITVPASGNVFTSVYPALNLDSLISADTNKLLTLVLIAGNSEHEFATKENTFTPPYLRPTLTFPNASIFTTRDYLVVENFNSYANTDALGVVWKDTSTNGTRAEISLETDPNYKTDGNSMKYKYTNSNPPYYAEAYAATTALPGQIGSNWAIGDVEALVLYFYGQAGNDANEKMYVKLTDGTNTKSVIYDGDMNDIREPMWHEWNIKLADFTGVDLNNVTGITIGFGDGSAGGDGTVFFEDIRLHPRRCALSKRSADFARADYIPAAGDCLVDYQELKIMADDWLMTSPPSYVDLYVDNKIDFKDFALLARQWLIEELWP